MTDPVAVRVRGCECLGTPHADEGDIVYLAPKLSLAGGLQANGDIIQAAGDGTVLAAAWKVTFVKHGAISWNWLDDEGEPVPFDVGVLLEDYTLSLAVADAADELYGDSVMRPLLARLKSISPNGQTSTPVSTSRTRPSTTKPRARSSPAITVASPPLTQ